MTSEQKKNIKVRRDLILEAEDDPRVQMQLYGECQNDILFYFKYFIWTFNPKVEPHHFPFVPYPFQEDMILSYSEEIETGKGSLTEKSREMGATYGILGTYLHKWNFKSYQEFLVLSLTEGEVDSPGTTSLFGKLRYMTERLPFWLLPEGYRPEIHGDVFKRLVNPANNSNIIGKATKEDAARSGRYTGVLIDEYSGLSTRLKEGLERSVNEATNSVHRITTPRGIDLFKRLRDSGNFIVHTNHWTQIDEKTEGLYYIIPKTKTKEAKKVKCPKLPKNRRSPYGFYIDEQGKLTRWKLRSPWYDAKAKNYPNLRDVAQELDISYLGSGHCRFDSEMIEAGMQRCKKGKRGRLVKDNNGIRFVEAAEGEPFELEVWQFPTTPYYDNRSAVAADTSEGLEKGDYSSADVYVSKFPASTGIFHAAHLHGHFKPDAFADRLDTLGRWYDGGARLMVERNKDGFGVLLRLRNVLKYPNLYYKDGEGKPEDRLGYYTTAKNKFTYTQEYDETLRAGELETLSIEHFSEMTTFINRDGHLGAEGSDFDDRVISGCLNYQNIKTMGKPSQKITGTKFKQHTRTDTSKY